MDGYYLHECEHEGDKSTQPSFPRPDHHTESCVIDYRYEACNPGTRKIPRRAFWCDTHHQWLYESPVKVVFTWADGSKTRLQ